MNYYELKYLEPEEFKAKFHIEPINRIEGMPSYYTIINDQFEVWPKLCKQNPIPKLAWKF